jgi:environmental stress-induced protein Ves
MRPASPALVLRAAERTARPWKDGGGVTREVAVHPPASALESFEWRVSIAEVAAGAPFSMFPGIDRRMAVLAGRLEFALAGEAAVQLSPASPPLSFPGEVAAFARPVGEPVTDLNVMTRRGRFDSRLGQRSASTTQLLLSADTTLLLALSQLVLRCAGEEHALAELDAARIEGTARCQVQARAAHGSFYLVELRRL